MNAQRRAAVEIALAAGALIASPVAAGPGTDGPGIGGPGIAGPGIGGPGIGGPGMGGPGMGGPGIAGTGFGGLGVTGPVIVEEEVDGNVLEARIRVLGLDLAELRVEFEEVEGLEPGALGLSAELLDLWGLIALVARLPDRLLTSVPAELPLILRFDPEPGVSFRGAAQLTFETDLLPYVPGTRLRLFQASGLGPFEDVTAETGAGSYRVGSQRPDFSTSSYVVATDLRSDQTVAERKLDDLDALLDARSGVIDPAVLADLEARATAVRAAFELGETADALAALDGFTAAVIAVSGAGIPDVWEAEETAANAAGELRSQAATLRFSLVEAGGG